MFELTFGGKVLCICNMLLMNEMRSSNVFLMVLCKVERSWYLFQNWGLWWLPKRV